MDEHFDIIKSRKRSTDSSKHSKPKVNTILNEILEVFLFK